MIPSPTLIIGAVVGTVVAGLAAFGYVQYKRANNLATELAFSEAHVEAVKREVVTLNASVRLLEELGVAGSSGYVDVDFEIGKYGVARKVTVVAVAGDDAAAVSKAVATAIDRARFRPSPVREGASYSVRYSLADGRLAPRR